LKKISEADGLLENRGKSWEIELRKDVARLLRTNNWLAVAKYNNDWREKTANAVTKKRAERTEETHEKSQDYQCHDRNTNEEFL
jgi:hypothetical protein